jgi:protein-tyrosine phosphatase
MALRIFWIELPLKGHLAIMPRPLGGELLDRDIAGLKAARVTTILSLIEPEEASELELIGEKDVCAAHGIVFLSYPIADRGLPTDGTSFATLARSLADKVMAGGSVAIHCRAGIGRSSLAAASILVQCGFTAELALKSISQARGLAVPDTDAQRAWILALR